VSSKSDFATTIDGVMKNNPPKFLSEGRVAYYDESTNILVIRDPNTADGGTCFRPTEGKPYYDRLK